MELANPFVLLAALSLVACGGTTTTGTTKQVDDPDTGSGGFGGIGASSGGVGGNANRTGSSTGSMTGGGTGHGGQRADAGSSAGSGGKSTSLDAGRDASVDVAPPPAEIPSKQTVTFNITNATTSDQYVVTDGWYCTPFGIDKVSDGGVASLFLQTGFPCPCECPAVGPPVPLTFRRIGPGESFSMTWDARDLVTYTEAYDCSHDWPGEGVQHFLTGVAVPVNVGTYRVTFGMESTLPTACSDAGPSYRCDTQSGGGSPAPDDLAAICPTTKTATATFFVPAAGNVVVPVSIK